MKKALFILLLTCAQLTSAKILDISPDWKQHIRVEKPILPYKLVRIVNLADTLRYGGSMYDHDVENSAYFAYLRKNLIDSNVFDQTSDDRVDIFYKIDFFYVDRGSKFLDNIENLQISYKVVTSSGETLFEQTITSKGIYDFTSKKQSKSWRANAQKFLVLFRSKWDKDFLLKGEKLWQAAEKDALDPNRTVSSVFLASAGKAFGTAAEIVEGAISATGDLLTDPAFITAVNQVSQDMNRQLEQKRVQDLKAYNVQKTTSNQQTNTSSKQSSTTSALNSSTANKSAVVNTSSSTNNNSNSKSGGQLITSQQTSTHNKQDTPNNDAVAQLQRDKEDKELEAKLAKEKKELEAKLAKEKKELEEKLAKEKKELELKAEKQRQEQEKLAQKQRELQEKNNYLSNVKNNLRLQVNSCFGENYVVGQLPQGLGSSKHVSKINVHYRVHCPGTSGYNGVSRNFVGMGTSCFTGDTLAKDGGLIPKSVLSCKAQEMTVQVVDVTTGD